MAKGMRFTDQHVRLLGLALKRPDERIIARCVGEHKPWWAFGLLKRTYFILATDQRAWVVEHAYSFLFGVIVKAVHMIPWTSTTEMRTKGLFMKKKLVFTGQAESTLVNGEPIGTPGLFKKTLVLDRGILGMLAPVSKNFENAKAMVEAWEHGRAAHGALAQGYPATPGLAFASGHPQTANAYPPAPSAPPQAPSGYPQAPSAYPQAPSGAPQVAQGQPGYPPPQQGYPGATPAAPLPWQNTGGYVHRA